MSVLPKTRLILHRSSEAVSGVASDDREEISSYLARYACVSLYAEIEDALVGMISDAGGRAKHVNLGRYLASTASARKHFMQQIDSSSIKRYLNRFGEDAGRVFNDMLDERVTSDFDSAISSRHRIAHRLWEGVTFGEMKRFLDASERVLRAFDTAINGAVQ